LARVTKLEPFKISETVESTNIFLKFDEFNQFLIKFSDFENSDRPNQLVFAQSIVPSISLKHSKRTGLGVKAKRRLKVVPVK
jgi:hypothetical protein